MFFVPPDTYRAEPLVKVWQPADTVWHDIEYAFSVSDGRGYCLEVKIPFQTLGIEGEIKGRPIGFELTLDDIDPGDYEHKQLIWRGGSNNWRDPGLFSCLYFD